MDYSSNSSSAVANSASEEDLQQTMDLRKRKRMISNRESARRSRLRKQKHMEELMAQVAELRRQNHQILTSLRATTQHHAAVQSENAILRAQEAELGHRLQSLVEIIEFTGGGAYSEIDVGGSWSQPIMMMAADAGPACVDLPRLLC
ncbi:bZIP transcription factor 44-like [Salvia hispanica]|uniref:bZIP transcription factor 44-like n=1 Tax=Salvia hispanica TaxID=49212 RepID=UPI002009750E|nr:bZIP transcription factor 44-like [Salvia hispanica]